jgi:alcohol dehydrogenase
MTDYRGYGKAARPLLPMIGIPTTAGTGSEAQSYALISHPVTHRKMACGDPKARFAEVILDPELLTTAPPPVTATAGLDALSHAVESYVSTAANPPSRLYAGEAFRLLSGALPALLGGGPPPAAWAAGLWGAHLAGAAIEQSMLGAAHALANPLTARYGIEHGAAVSLGLPGVVRFNGAVAAKRYGELARAAGLVAIDPVEAVATRIEELRALAGLPARLPQAGVPAGAPLPELAREAAEQWTGRFNPRPVTEKELLELYESVA